MKNNKSYNKRIALILMASILFWMTPATSVMAAGSDASGGLNSLRTGSKGAAADADGGSAAEAAEGQVVVLYEDGEIPSESGDTGTGSADQSLLCRKCK